MKKKHNFILIDDSPFDLFIFEKLLIKSKVAESVEKYFSAKNALSWLQETTDLQNDTIILLDLQMPDMNGFEFMHAFQNLPFEITSKITVYMLSSTIDSRDIEKIQNNPLIVDLLSKPLNIEILKSKLGIC